MVDNPFASQTGTLEAVTNSLRLISSTFSLSGNGSAENLLNIGNDANYYLLAISEYHVGTYKFNFRLYNQDWFFLGTTTGGSYTMTYVNNDAIFSVDPVNSLTEAKFVLPKKVLIKGGSGIDVQVYDRSGAANTVILTFQLLKAA